MIVGIIKREITKNYFLIFNQDHLLVSLTSICVVSWPFCCNCSNWFFNFSFSASQAFNLLTNSWGVKVFNCSIFWVNLIISVSCYLILSNNSCFCLLFHSSDFSWNLAISSLSISNTSSAVANSSCNPFICLS